MRISFFVPPAFLENKHGENIDQYLENVDSSGHRYLGTTGCWIYQTWSRLKKAGLACELLTEPPEEGILFLHSPYKNMAAHEKHDLFDHPELLSKNLFIVDLVADEKPHPRAHLHVFENRAYSRLVPGSLFIPHWSQAHLIPRDPKRGSRFENIAYMGYVGNLALELLSEEWNDALRRTAGLHFSVIKSSRWHDYSNIDGVVAIRDFSRSRHFRKPATKLYNAWLAGVPFVGGRDSAFSAEGHHGKNYLAANSPQHVLSHLKRLKENKKLRSSLVENGARAGLLFTQDAILQYWKTMIQDILPGRVLAWQRQSDVQRRCASLVNRALCAADRYWIR